MRTADLEKIPIATLRNLAKQRNLPYNKKQDIIAALSNEEASSDVVGTAGSLIEGALQHLVQSSRPTSDELKALIREVLDANSGNGNGIRVSWAQVPIASAHINGAYIYPPFWERLKASIQFSHVELKGPPGSGKTLAVHKLADENKKHLAVVTAEGGLRKRDLIGAPEMSNATTYYQAAEFASAAKNGDWALIDEISMADADTLGFLLGMLDRPGMQGSTFSIAGTAFPVHPNFRCFITRNPGLAGTQRMNEALLDRFVTFVVPPLLGNDLDRMLVAHGVDELFRKQSVPVVDMLYRAWEKNNIAYQISPRRVLEAAQIAKGTGVKDRVGFREILCLSILDKIEESLERDAVSKRLTTQFEVLDLKRS